MATNQGRSRLGAGRPRDSRRGTRLRPDLESLEGRWVPSNLPPGFTETVVASGLNDPTAMAEAPDGRIFVCEQGGTLRVIQNGQLLATPFVSLNVDDTNERGLLGVALDPNFEINNYVYVYYTVPGSHNRVSRFTAGGNVAVSGSEVDLLDLDGLSGATNHNGGAIHFGPDGRLYIGVGDNANGANAQSLNTLLGKMLRINSGPGITHDDERTICLALFCADQQLSPIRSNRAHRFDRVQD